MRWKGEEPALSCQGKVESDSAANLLETACLILYPQFKMKQGELAFRGTWGGKRKGAGRPRGERVSHHQRPRFAKQTPAHVTLRVRRHVWNLRSRRAYRRIAECLE